MAENRPTKWSKSTLSVPKFGTIQGICFDGKTTQYLGIPYATIPGRFRRPQPVKAPWPDHYWDGTKLGCVPATSPPYTGEKKFCQPRLIKPQQTVLPTTSEGLLPYTGATKAMGG
jgi:hypothetical protein